MKKGEEYAKLVTVVGHESNINGMNLWFGLNHVELDFDKYMENP